MPRTGGQVLEILDRLISQAEERRIEQMIRISRMHAANEDPTEAEDDLRKLHSLLRGMREQRRIEEMPMPMPDF